MSKNTYPALPEDLHRPLTKAEVREILNARGKGFTNKRRKIMHFLERTLLTIEDKDRKIKGLEGVNIDLRAQIAAKTGYGASMDPEFALQYVDPAVLVKYGNQAAQQLADAAEAKSMRLEAVRSDIRGRLLDIIESQASPEMTQLAKELISILDQA